MRNAVVVPGLYGTLINLDVDGVDPLNLVFANLNFNVAGLTKLSEVLIFEFL